MYRRALIWIMILGFSISVEARIINIPADYSTIQAGIDAAVTGDTVMVAPGTYTETLSLSNKNILLTSSSGPDSTIIIGRTTIGSNVDTNTVIRGFHFGNSNGFVLVGINDCSTIFEANILSCAGDNAVALSLSNSNSIIRNNIVGGISGIGGGIAISCNNGYPIIDQNIIRGNNAHLAEYAGFTGISMNSGIIRRNLINDNSSYSGYLTETFGIVASGTSYQIMNNTVVRNSANSLYHGGLGISFGVPLVGDSIQIKNNIIAFNHIAGVGATITDSSWTGWDYNLVFGNDPSDYPGLQPGPHDIQADPLFVDTASHDFHLLPNSPCIDAGDPDSPLDPDGTRADIGAYYFDQPVGINDGKPTGPYQFELHQNYPNPFNSNTIISYELSEQAIVSLRIVSITGQIIVALAKKEQQNAGDHHYIWEGRDKNGRMVSTGIYFYELYVDDYRESKAMIMIK